MNIKNLIKITFASCIIFSITSCEKDKIPPIGINPGENPKVNYIIKSTSNLKRWPIQDMLDDYQTVTHTKFEISVQNFFCT